MNYEQDQKDKKEAQIYVEKYEKLKSQRTTTETHWQEAMQYIVPRKDDITKTTQAGAKHGQELFDTTAITANQMLAGALHGMLTNPAVRFFDLVFGDPALDEQEEVKQWLQENAEKMFVVMNNSNFQTEVHEIYLDEGAIGTACLYIGEHETDIVHFAARPMREIYVDENNLGLIDTVYRMFKWKPKHIVQEFGEENVHPEILDLYEKGCTDQFEIIHATEPSDEKDPDIKGVFPFKSVYILKDKSIFLSKKGFKEFPYAVPRWTKNSGEVYGRGPGMDLLPDIKMVNAMMQTTIEGAMMTVRPPYVVEDDAVLGKFKLTPGGVTVVRPGSTVTTLNSNARIDFGYQAVEDVRKRIRVGFYGDLFQLQSGPQKTATEVNTIAEQQMKLMGPILGRQHFEFLKPVVERVFGIMSRKGMITPAPKIIHGKKFDVRYSSLIARAQRMSEGQDFIRAINVAAPIINAKPEALDNLNPDAALKYVFSLHGVPSKVFNTAKQVQQIRDGRANAQQKAAEMQDAQHQADVAGKVMPGAAQMMQAQNQKG